MKREYALRYKFTYMKKLYYLLIPSFILLSFSSIQPINAQEVNRQTIRGTIIDKNSRLPIEAAEIFLEENKSIDESDSYGNISDENGKFRVEDVPVGRYRVEFHYLGYESIIMNDIVVTSGREVILDVEMESTSQTLSEVTIKVRDEGNARNEMAMVSAREFSVEETERYAGSRGEPARMASNYAGVQGADDSRNDIIIRGNTPSGVLWRLEGVNIPNPNHFSIPGTAGGPVTIINNVYLANSDFFTGAFPAEYGNALAGVFDLKMRNGNNEKHEFSGQLGFLGTEFKAEGPISRASGSSYLATYRYSTLSLFEFMNVKIGTDAVPRYQDGALRLNFPLNKKMNLAVFGIGGSSNIDIVLSDIKEQTDETLLYGDNDRDQYFGSDMGVIAATLSHSINSKTFMKTSIAASHHRVHATHDKIIRHLDGTSFVLDSTPTIMRYQFVNNQFTLASHISNRLSDRFELKSGIIAEAYQHDFIDSAKMVIFEDSTYTFHPWKVRWDNLDYSANLQVYSQFKWAINPSLLLTGGVTYFNQFIAGNVHSSIEPRIGMKYSINHKSSLNFGSGLHSQAHPYYIYYFLESNNLDLDLSKNIHFVLGYDYKIAQSLRFKTETYYQHLFNIPVDKEPSAFSLVNAGSGFSRLFPKNMVNAGIGTNYGIEFTLEKYFSRNYYFLLTASLFDSKYQGSNGVWHNTTFNGRYAFNGLFAYEFNLTANTDLNVGGKLTYVGGRWYGDVDKEESARLQELIFDNETMNTKQFRPYFRADTKVSLRMNRRGVSHELSLDLVNVFNIQNILTLTYAPEHPSGNLVTEEYQLGFLPIFYYKIDF